MNEQQFHWQRTKAGIARASVTVAQGLTAAERATLAAFAAEHGRTWKADLRHLWMTGGASPELQALRNTGRFGPAGLAKVRASDLN